MKHTLTLPARMKRSRINFIFLCLALTVASTGAVMNEVKVASIYYVSASKTHPTSYIYEEVRFTGIRSAPRTASRQNLSQ